MRSETAFHTGSSNRIAANVGPWRIPTISKLTENSPGLIDEISGRNIWEETSGFGPVAQLDRASAF